MNRAAAFILSSVVAVTGCTASIHKLPVTPGVEEVKAGEAGYREKVQIRYLGAGGFLILRGDHGILTAPFFSNPSLKRVMFWKIAPNPDQIERFLPSPSQATKGVEALLVGHAHYDHLMDVPHIVSNYFPGVKIYGSQTMRHILAAALDSGQLVALDADAGIPARPGRWYHTSNSRLRFMPLHSEHAPHFMGIKVYKGQYRRDRVKLPTRAGGWREGQTLAYLIDFMSEDGMTVEFRIHYQDAASNPPCGFPPSFDQPGNQRRVDVAILCVPGFDQVKDYPEGIIHELDPRFVILSHWENFFAPLPDDWKNLRTVPQLDAEKFIRRLRAVFPSDDRIKMPAPGAWLRFEP